VNSQEIVRKILPNGMEVVVKKNDTNSSAGVYCFVKTGSNYEDEYLGCGISHYLEHLVSGGTTTYRTESDYKELYKKYGIISNAYTNYFVTAFHLTGEAVYADSMITYLSEVISACTLDDFEVSREKEVILKEIVMRSSPIRSQIYQRSNEVFYPNSPVKNPVIGYVNLFRDITMDDLENYYKKNYVPNNMIFVVVGDIDVQATMSFIEKTFADFERKPYNPVLISKQTPYSGNLMVVEEFPTETSQVTMKYILPGMTEFESSCLTTGMHNLMGPRKAPLAYKLKEEMKLVDSISGYASSLSRDKYPEVTINFSPQNPADINRIIEIIDTEIENQIMSGLSEQRLKDYVNRYKSWLVMKSEDADRECNTIGMNMIFSGVPFTTEGEIEMLEQITTTDMASALTKYVVPKNRLIFCAVPTGTADSVNKNNSIVAEKKEFKRLLDKKDVSLMIKENHKRPILDVEIYISTSTDFESENDWNCFEAVADMMFRGSKNYSSLDLTEWFENHLVRPEVSIGQYGLNISFSCMKDDYPELQKIILDALNNPTFDESELEMFRQELRARLKRSSSDVGTAHRNFRNKTLYGNTKNGLSSQESIERKLALTRKDYQRIYSNYMHGEKLTMVFVGDITEHEAENYCKTLKNNITMKKINGERNSLVIPSLNDTFNNPYDFEQVNVDINVKAPLLSDPDYYAFFVMNQILSGSNGRLHKATRGENNLAYFAYASYSATKEYGFFRVTSQTSLDKKDQLIQTLQTQLDNMQSTLVDQEEIDLSIGEWEQQIKSMISDENIAGYIMSTEITGRRFEDRDKEMEKYKKVTPQQIMDVAKKYLNSRAIINSYPKDDVKKLVD
jgi:zinc protease